MQQYKYKSINDNGRIMRGVVAAVNETDLYEQLQSAGLELLDCSVVRKTSFNFGGKNVTTRDLIQLFVHLQQLQNAGVPLLECLADVRDTTDNTKLRDIISEVTRNVSEGESFADALARYPKVFNNIIISMIKAAQDTGDFGFAYEQLIKYLKWYDGLKSKIKKATQYPMILLFVIIGTISFMMGLVVPQITGFLENSGQDIPIYTRALMNTSSFFQNYWYVVVFGPMVLFGLYKFGCSQSEEFAYRADSVFLKLPVFGDIMRKINIARYSQTFASLFAAGIDVINCLRSAQKTIDNKAILLALDTVERQVQIGSPLSVAFQSSGEFPNMVVRMVKIGEESGGLTPVLDQVSEFYSRDVDEAIDGMVTMIEPALTAVMGLMIAWIALAVFGPIYGSFKDLPI